MRCSGSDGAPNTMLKAVIILNHAIGSKISPAFRISISLPYHWTMEDVLQRGGTTGQQSADHYLVRTRSFVIVSQTCKRYMIPRYSTCSVQAVRRRYCLGTLCGADNATPRTDLAGHAALRASDTLSDVALRGSNPGAAEMLAATSYPTHSGDHSVITFHERRPGPNPSSVRIQVHSVAGHMALQYV